MLSFKLMKKLLGLFLFSCACLLADSESIDLRSHGSLTLFLPDGWNVVNAEYGDRAMVTIEPKGDVNAKCSITVTFPEHDDLSTKAKLRKRIETDSAELAARCVEGKAVAREIQVRQGFGFYCNFTDPELVGKKPQKGNYKTISGGLIRVAPDVLVEFSIMSDGFRTEAYQHLLGAIEGMEYMPARRR